jgi:hypothetical protein
MHNYAGNPANYPLNVGLVDDADLNPATAASLDVSGENLADRTAYLKATTLPLAGGTITGPVIIGGTGSVTFLSGSQLTINPGASEEVFGLLEIRSGATLQWDVGSSMVGTISGGVTHISGAAISLDAVGGLVANHAQAIQSAVVGGIFPLVAGGISSSVINGIQGFVQGAIQPAVAGGIYSAVAGGIQLFSIAGLEVTTGASIQLDNGGAIEVLSGGLIEIQGGGALQLDAGATINLVATSTIVSAAPPSGVNNVTVGTFTPGQVVERTDTVKAAGTGIATFTVAVGTGTSVGIELAVMVEDSTAGTRGMARYMTLARNTGGSLAIDDQNYLAAIFAGGGGVADGIAGFTGGSPAFVVQANVIGVDLIFTLEAVGGAGHVVQWVVRSSITVMS